MNCSSPTFASMKARVSPLWLEKNGCQEPFSGIAEGMEKGGVCQVGGGEVADADVMEEERGGSGLVGRQETEKTKGSNLHI